MIIDELINFMISSQNFKNNSWEKILKKISNLDSKMIAEVEKKLQLTFVPEIEDGNLCFISNNDELQDAYKQTFTPADLTNYIFAVLCTPQYKDKYKKFFKIDLPLFPYPKKTEDFWKLVRLGGEMRRIDLLEKPAVEKNLAKYLIDGDNVVQKPKFIKSAPAMISAVNSSPINDVAVNSLPSTANACNGDAINSPPEKGNSVVENLGRVYINETQYFDNVPETAWNFNVGGYQPAQKWLKDRKGKTLKLEDIQHYQKIIVSLFQTNRLMKEINKIEIN